MITYANQHDVFIEPGRRNSAHHEMNRTNVINMSASIKNRPFTLEN